MQLRRPGQARTRVAADNELAVFTFLPQRVYALEGSTEGSLALSVNSNFVLDITRIDLDFRVEFHFLPQEIGYVRTICDHCR